MSESDPDRSGPLALAGEDLDDVPECWRNEISECLESSQEDSDKVDEAEACKTSSDDEESDDPPPSWWVSKLERAWKTAYPNDALPTSSLGLKRLVSGCTGCGAEFEVFKAQDGQWFGGMWSLESRVKQTGLE